MPPSARRPPASLTPRNDIPVEAIPPTVPYWSMSRLRAPVRAAAIAAMAPAVPPPHTTTPASDRIRIGYPRPAIQFNRAGGERCSLGPPAPGRRRPAGGPGPPLGSSRPIGSRSRSPPPPRLSPEALFFANSNGIFPLTPPEPIL